MIRFAVSVVALIASSAIASGDNQPLRPVRTLHTPDIIAPAVLPYLACLYAERGLPLLRASDGTQVPFEKSTEGCSAARTRAIQEANTLLDGKTVPNGLGADAFITRTLADMDAYVRSLPVPDNKNAQSEKAVIGLPVTIEDVVQPAYDRYDECLKTQVSQSLVSSQTVQAKFREAMATCASVRAFAVSEAAKALAAKGWDEAARIRAAENTFAKIDESWLVMGKQYETALRAKDAELAARNSGHSPTDKQSALEKGNRTHR